MDEFELTFPDNPDSVRDLARNLGLVAKEMTLKSCPGAIHWHFTRPGQKGTLEATWWLEKQRFWLKVHPLRRANWQAAAINKFSQK